jgi:site-specific DNA-cytosine methylase
VTVDAAHAFKVRGGCEGGGKGYLGSDEVAFTISTHQDQHIFSEAIGFNGDQSEKTRSMGEKEEQAPTLRAAAVSHVAYAIQERAVCENPDAGPDGIGVRADDAAYTLEARSTPQAVAFQPTADCLTAAYGTKWNGNASATNGSLFAQQQSTVRRLTPVECERLQGFPDNFTAIPWRKKGAEDCPDGPRYKALGNSMAVPVMRWIGERIHLVDDYLSII